MPAPQRRQTCPHERTSVLNFPSTATPKDYPQVAWGERVGEVKRKQRPVRPTSGLRQSNPIVHHRKASTARREGIKLFAQGCLYPPSAGGVAPRSPLWLQQFPTIHPHPPTRVGRPARTGELDQGRSPEERKHCRKAGTPGSVNFFPCELRGDAGRRERSRAAGHHPPHTHTPAPPPTNSRVTS